MKIAVLGSGSRGNAVLVTSSAGTLLVDAGFGLSTLTRRAASVGMALDSLAGIVVTHEHGDHARGVAAAAAAAQCPVYASFGTLRALGLEPGEGPARSLDPAGTVAIGGFEVRAVRTSHDAAEPVALQVRDGGSGGRVGIAYDIGRFTPALRRLLSSVHCLILEANHDEHLLRTGPYPRHLRQRIAGPAGHLSNWQAGQVAAELCHDELETVVLAHLSEQCNRPDLARDTVGAALSARGFRGAVVVAAQETALEPITLRGKQLALDLFG
jgi:phosphoribosyl 1,2-cyclic phosphodiesterase